MNIERPVIYAEGKEPPPDAPLSQAKLAVVWWHAEQVGADIPRFCQYMGIPSIEAMTMGQFPKAIGALNRKAEQNRGKAA